MPDIKEKIIFDDSEVIKSFNDQFTLITKVNNAVRETEMTYKEAYDIAQKELEATNQATKQLNQAVGKNITETAKAKKVSKDWGDSLKDVADNINIMGVNLGGVISNLQQKQAAIKGVTSSLGGMVGGLRAVKVAIAATGIGALILALGALIPLLTKSEKATDQMAGAMKTLGAMGDFVLPRITHISNALGKLILLDFKGAAESWKKGTDNFASGLANAAEMGAFLARQLDEIQDLQRDQIVIDAKSKREVADLLLQAADRNKQLETRIGLLREVQRIEEENAQNEFEIKRALFLNEKLRLNLKKENITEAEKENLAALESAAILADANRQAVKINEERRISSFIAQERADQEAAAKERLEQIKAVNEALDQQVAKILQAADKVASEQLSPEERILAEANAAKLIIGEEFKKLEELAKAAGKEVDLTEEKVALIQAIELKAIREIERLKGEAAERLPDVILEPLKIAQRGIPDIVAGVEEGLKKIDANQQVADKYRSLGEKIQDALGLDEQGMQEILKGFGSLFSSLFDLTNANTEAAIEKNNELLDSIRERQDALDDDLEKEKERQKAGLANNLELKETERQLLKKEEEKALKEQEKLQKKALAQQLLQDALQQGSSIATMAANVTAKSSLLGPAGIPVALATIAAFISIISKIKNSSKKLYTGGSLEQDGVTGFVNKSGRTDRNGGRGHRVEDSNLILGGREFVVNEGTAAIHGQFLEALNRGDFDNGPALNYLLKHGRDMEHNQAIVTAYEKRNTAMSQAAMMERAIGRHMAGVSAAIKSQGKMVAYRPGDLLRKEENGTVTIIQTEENWRWKPERRG